MPDGTVWVSPRTRHADGEAHWRNRLREGLEQNIGLVIAKAVLGRLAEGADPQALVRDALLFGASHRDGWGTGQTTLVALANLLPSLPADEAYLALYQGIRRVAADCEGEPPRRDREPLADGAPQAPAQLGRWLRHWTAVRHRDGAERTLLTALAGGASPAEVAALLLAAATDRYFADGGHALDFINKAFEGLDIAGWEQAPALLPTVIEQLVSARGGEELNAWRQPVDLIALCAERLRRAAGAAGGGPDEAGRLAGSCRPRPRPAGRRSGGDRGGAAGGDRRGCRRRRSRPGAGLCRGAAGRLVRHRQRAFRLGHRPSLLHLLQRHAPAAEAGRRACPTIRRCCAACSMARCGSI